MMTVAFWVGIGSGEPILTTSLPSQITMEDGSPYYIPVTATVVSGTPIRWENPTPTHHTVTHNGCVEDGGSCLFDSGAVSPGSHFVVSGLPAGRYAYHCRIHPIMRGQLTVTDDSSTPAHL
jgi:plastocyanin